MKKSTLKLMAFAMMLGGVPVAATAQTYSPTASTTIYDISNYKDQALLDVFVAALENGRDFPTVKELQDAGVYEELEFVRSHTRKREIMSRADRLIPDTYETRNLWMNIPTGSGQDNLGGYPSKDFASDNYSMWNYTNLFGSWNHSLFTAPGSWVDAAHKNGTDIMSGIKFFDTTGNPGGVGAEGWNAVITQKNSDGTFRYTRALINLLRFLGHDGINYNWEATGYSNSTVVAFHQELWKIAKEVGFTNYHSGIYTSASVLTASYANALYGSSTAKTHDLMLNYSGGDFSTGISTSVTSAENAMGTADGLYTGVWIVTMNRRWTALDQDAQSHKCGVCLWGEHGNSRFWSYNTGDDGQSRMYNYQHLLEKAFSGGNRHPLNRPAVVNSGNEWEGTNPLGNFAGLATWIPERSTIQGSLPFATYFNLGNGDRYNYKGKKTHGSWYNMSAQDIVPTYRWLVYDGGTTTASSAISPSFTNADAYTGGACLELLGVTSAASTDLILYKTSLTSTTGNAYATVAVKDGIAGTTPSNLYLILKKKGDSSYKEYAVGNIDNKEWQEVKIPLTDITAGDVIESIGLRTKNTDKTYQLYVGKIEINDDIKATPSDVKDLTIQVKEETKNTLTVKATWSLDFNNVDGRNIFNDEANIDHFEILYKNGEEGRVSEVGRTAQWAALISDIQLPNVDDAPFIGVRAVSTDLKTYSTICWAQVPRAAQSELPEKKDDSYGISEIDKSAAGYETALKWRWIENFNTLGAEQDIDYAATGPAGNETNYVDATDHVLKVRQGQTVTIRFNGYYATDAKDGTHDDLRYCMGKLWIDLDGSKTFASEMLEEDENGECLLNLGTLRAADMSNVDGTKSVTFTMPADATPGKSRMRLVFTDAWFAGTLMPTGLNSKGFSIDFGVEILGDNPGRTAAADIHDQGEAEEPEGIHIVDNITVLNGEASTVVATDGQLEFQNTAQAWLFSANGTMVKTVTNPSVVSTRNIPAGVYLVKMKNGNVIRTDKVVVK